MKQELKKKVAPKKKAATKSEVAAPKTTNADKALKRITKAMKTKAAVTRLDILIRARKILETKWVKGSLFAKPIDGSPPHGLHFLRHTVGDKTIRIETVDKVQDGVLFCSIGGYMRAEWELKKDGYNASSSARSATHLLDPHVPVCNSTIGFNDGPMTKHEEVLALFDRAIAAEKDKKKS